MLIIKKLLKELNPVLLFLTMLLFAIPFMSILLLILGVPVFTANFFKLLVVVSVLDAIAAILYFKALNISEISLIAPISSFNPVFTLFFAFFLLHESPTAVKFSGILVIVLGTYLLNVSHIRSGILKPFSKLFSDNGVKLFFAANFIWAITPIFQKSAIFQTSPPSPLSVPVMESIIIVLLLSPILIRGESVKRFATKNIKWLILFGLMTTLGQLAAMSAFSLTNVSYSVAIFKLSALFSVILGAVFFNEKQIKERFLGAAVMVLGTILIAL